LWTIVHKTRQNEWLMHRAAAFVDIGYLLASGGALCLGTDVIASVSCDYPSLVEALEHVVAEDSALPLLRSYWYDAADSDGSRSDLRGLSALWRVKVRLGVRGWAGQKEVDILLHDDLVGLSAGGLVATIYLLSGDGDFRPTIERAQAYGVEVVVLDIPVGRTAQSLLRAADRSIPLPASFWEPFFTRKPAFAPRPNSNRSPARSTGDVFESSAQQAGADFAFGWLKTASSAELARLKRQGHLSIPPRLDAELIRSVERATGLLRDHPELKICARAGFWSVLARTDL
jgi:hypothetical protein